MIQDYLQNQKQRTKITFRVPQGSILGPRLFNVFLCYLFFDDEANYFANYADDTTPYITGKNTTEVLKVCIV